MANKKTLEEKIKATPDDEIMMGSTELEKKIRETKIEQDQVDEANLSNAVNLIEFNLRNNFIFGSDEDQAAFEELKNAPSSTETTQKMIEISEAMTPYNEEQALKIAQALMSKSEPPETLTQPLAERGYFETKARVPITQSILDQLSNEAQVIIKGLLDLNVEKSAITNKIKDLEKKADEIFSDIATKTHQVDIMAKWFFNWDEDYKRLIGVYEGKEIIINQVDLTSVDRQMKLDDAIQQAKDEQGPTEAPEAKAEEPSREAIQSDLVSFDLPNKIKVDITLELQGDGWRAGVTINSNATNEIWGNTHGPNFVGVDPKQTRLESLLNAMDKVEKIIDSHGCMKGKVATAFKKTFAEMQEVEAE